MEKKLILIAVSFIVPFIVLVKTIQFNQDCKGYLKQCSNASSVELALERLNKALDYIENNNLTHGYTSVLWKTENDNIGYWYNNLKTCQTELQQATTSNDQLLKTNVLMKVRETITDQDEYGTFVTVPNGIVKYPNNLLYGILLWISIIIICSNFLHLIINEIYI